MLNCCHYYLERETRETKNDWQNEGSVHRFEWMPEIAVGLVCLDLFGTVMKLVCSEGDLDEGNQPHRCDFEVNWQMGVALGFPLWQTFEPFKPTNE